MISSSESAQYGYLASGGLDRPHLLSKSSLVSEDDQRKFIHHVASRMGVDQSTDIRPALLVHTSMATVEFVLDPLADPGPRRELTVPRPDGRGATHHPRPGSSSPVRALSEWLTLKKFDLRRLVYLRRFGPPQAVWSTKVALGALVRTDSTPFCAADLVLYPSLLAITSPFAAFRRNRN